MMAASTLYGLQRCLPVMLRWWLLWPDFTTLGGPNMSNRQSQVTVCMPRETGSGSYVMRREHLSPAYTTDWVYCLK